MARRATLFTKDDWPEYAKKGDYSPWEPTGKARVDDKIAEIWEKNESTSYQNKPQVEQCRRGLKRILDSWIWRLKKEDEQKRTFPLDPDIVLDRIQTNGPFSYVDSSKKLDRVDLFFELTLTIAISDGEKKAQDEFVKRYGAEIVAFAKKLGDDRVDAQDASSFQRWRDYFFFDANSCFKNYRGRAPLRSYLRISIFRMSKERDVFSREDELVAEPTTEEFDQLDPSEIAVRNENLTILKRALFDLEAENKEQRQIIDLRLLEGLDFLKIASKLGYNGKEDAIKKKASRNYKRAERRLQELCKIEEKKQAKSEQNEI